MRGLISSSKQSQEIKEEVDEVEIEREGSEHSNLVCGFVFFCTIKHGLNLLAIVGCESDEDDDTDYGDDEIHHRIADEDIDNACDDDAYETHEADVAYLGEIALGDAAIECHGAKCACSHKECGSDRRHAI